MWTNIPSRIKEAFLVSISSLSRLERATALKAWNGLSTFNKWTLYLSFIIPFIHIWMRLLMIKLFESLGIIENMKPPIAPVGYAPIDAGWERFFKIEVVAWLRDCFHRPITGVPGARMNVLEREWDTYFRGYRFTGRTLNVLNLGSYNYLGFAENEGACVDGVAHAISRYGLTLGSSRMEVGTNDLVQSLEALVASFVGQEAAICYSMGFATNSTTIPALVSKGCLVISDELNHASLAYGSRVSGATIRTFKHNDMASLENLLKDSIVSGEPSRSGVRVPWKKILVVVEGLYSMEGTMCPLKQLAELKKKYKFYLYVDEAHSIGSVGNEGKGVCNHFGVNPRDVDILMGTFTKSFNGAGGYISGSRRIIDHLRLHSHSAIYAESMSVPVMQQIYAATKIIMGIDDTTDGRRRILQLQKNTRRLRWALNDAGFVVLGNDHSPVIPVILYHGPKVAAFSRMLLEKGVGVVVVGFPATAVFEPRARICVSAAHTDEDIDYVINQFNELGSRLVLKYKKTSWW